MEHEPRKLIKFGSSSHIISIPQKWIQNNSLKKGDMVFLTEGNENELILSPKDKKIEKKDKKMIINIDGKDYYDIAREFISSYINNYSEIKFIGKELEQKKNIISEMINLKIGIEIIEQSADSIIAKDLLDLEAISIKNIYRRMDNILRSMFEELTNGMNNQKFKSWLYREIYKIDADINKFYFLVWKIVRKAYEEPLILKHLNLNQLELSNLQWMSLYIELIGDEIKRVAKFLTNANFDEKEREELKHIIEHIERIYIDSMNYYYKEQRDNIYPLMREKSIIIEKCEKLTQKSNNNNLNGICERIKTMCSAVHNITKILTY
jgi:phosphate uptake regulator